MHGSFAHHVHAHHPGESLVGTDHQARHEFVRQAVKVAAVEFGAGAAAQITL